jgi:hypothetical protein
VEGGLGVGVVGRAGASGDGGDGGRPHGGLPVSPPRRTRHQQWQLPPPRVRAALLRASEAGPSLSCTPTGRLRSVQRVLRGQETPKTTERPASCSIWMLSPWARCAHPLLARYDGVRRASRSPSPAFSLIVTGPRHPPPPTHPPSGPTLPCQHLGHLPSPTPRSCTGSLTWWLAEVPLGFQHRLGCCVGGATVVLAYAVVTPPPRPIWSSNSLETGAWEWAYSAFWVVSVGQP